MNLSPVDLESCLPLAIREHSPVLTKIAVGLSGAGVYRVDAGSNAYVLRIADASVDPVAWQRQLRVEQAAAKAGIAPPIVHIDPSRRAVVSAFVADRSFGAFIGNPASHGAALDLLASTFRRLHALPIPADAISRDPRELLASTWSELHTAYALPAFVRELVERMLAAPAPVDNRAPVLGHNDPNPSNMIYDGTDLLLLDWDQAGPMHPFYDLAVIAMFTRLNDESCARLLSSYEGRTVTELPPVFSYLRQISAVACGLMIVRVACLSGHKGDPATSLVATPSLGDCYAKMRTGALDLRSGAGQWEFGLALIKESSLLSSRL